jgi:hypothetical protein
MRGYGEEVIYNPVQMRSEESERQLPTVRHHTRRGILIE